MYFFGWVRQRYSILATVVLLGALHPIEAAAQTPLRAGVAKVDITPSDLTGLISIVRRPFQGVRDRIHARALVIESDGVMAAIVSVDVIHYGNTVTLRQRIQRELGIPADNIMIAATHTHSAPRAGPPTPGTAAVIQKRPYSTPAYLRQADDSVIEALRQATASLQPAMVGTGRGSVDINTYRYAYREEEGRWRAGVNPDGPSDKTVWVIKFEDHSGNPVALLMNYAVHSNIWTGTSADEHGDLISGDIAGVAETYIENHFDNQAVALFTLGAAGDQYAKFNKEMDDAWDDTPAAELVDVQGRMLAMEVLQTASRIPHMSELGRIQASQRAVPCPMVSNASHPDGETLDIQLGLIRINDTAMTSISGEIATNIYTRLRKESPLTRTLMATLVNDRAGYIPDTENWERMGAAFVRGCAEDAIVDNLIEMIENTQR